MIALNRWSECIPLRLWRTTCTDRDKLRVICFNIDGSTGNIREKAIKVRDFLRRYPTDIVFIAEYNEQHPRILDSLLNEDFKYSTFHKRLLFQYFYGNYPLFNARRLKDKKGIHVGVYVCSTIYKSDTIDLYGCHFASNNYNQNQEREGIESIGDKDDALKYVDNIQDASLLREIEAETVVGEILKSPHHAILLGDLNDVGGSKALRFFENNGLSDSWWEGGVGYGATIHYPLPYRIDHIMYSRGLKLETIRVLSSNGLSDHDALYADLVLIKNSLLVYGK